MLRSVWKENLHSLFKQRNAALVLALGMMVTNIMLGVKVLVSNEKIIVVPAYLKQSFWAEGEVISKEYLEEMTVFFASMMLNVSPESLKYQGDVVLKYVSPELHAPLKQRLFAEEEKMRKQNLTTSFKPKEVQVDMDKGEAVISGILTQYVSGQKVGQVSEKYRACYGYSSGILLLKEFEAIDD